MLEQALSEAQARGIQLDAEARHELARRAIALMWSLCSASESRYARLAERVLLPLMKADRQLKFGEALARLRARNPFAAQAVDLLHQAASLDAQQFAEDLGCDPSELDDLNPEQPGAFSFTGAAGRKVSLLDAAQDDLALLVERLRKRAEWLARAGECDETKQ